MYNTLTTALLKITHEAKTYLTNGNLSNADDNTISALKQAGIIVEDDLDELAAYRYFYNSMQYSEVHEELKIVVVPTYSCNLKCFYCFEECGHLGSKIDEDKVSQILRFVEHQLQIHHSYKKLSLILFGGEPLICKKQCIEFCQKLSTLLATRAISFAPKIITNATLLDDEVISKLIIPYNMGIQVTLDGIEEQHNQRKLYKSGEGSYLHIVQAIELLNQYGCKNNIDLRLNIDKDNIDCIEPIFDAFHDKVKIIYIGLLRPYGNNSCHTDACISENDFQINYRTQVLPILKKYGMANNTLNVGKQHPCGMNRKNTFVIDPFLDVYKCENFLGDKSHAIGHISDGQLQTYPEYYKQVAWTPFNDKCNKCALLPACAGSCPHLCFMENGDMNKPLCNMSKKQLIMKLCNYIDDLSNG